MTDYPSMLPISRRRFLTLTATAAGSLVLRPLYAAEAGPLPPLTEGISFFLIGDTHYLANKDNPSELDAVSRAYTAGLIERLNQLPGSDLPEIIGGGKLPVPSGLIHAGDLIDSGNTGGELHEKMI